MAIEVVPLPLPHSADATKFANFGREVRGVDLRSLDPAEFKQIEELLYKHSALLFRNVDLSPAQQYALAKAFDPTSESFGHGNKKIENTKSSILHQTLRAVPAVPQVYLVGNGTIYDHEGIPELTLQHPSHKTWHKAHQSAEDQEKGATRFVRWHMDAAFYDFNPPRVTTLYGINVPQGPRQMVKYDDGTGDELEVPLAATAFVSGKTMFDILPHALKSLAVRSSVKYAPHPYVWISTAKAKPTGLGIETEGLEMRYDLLPEWEESKIQVLPLCWKNPVTGDLHLQVHPMCAAELMVDPLPESAQREDALYPDGGHITDLQELRDLLYQMQRPGIAPQLVYPHDWRAKDLIIFHNRGAMHSVTGNLKPDQIRTYHQCNLAASDRPVGPSADDIKIWS
ncbi:Clavaminate synthase-like protein [Laetiporus sulphureus 93-53]|uniref:Clavaminate synthase-like protein n=1 Tax=Laetiporus sulphureus 93-53 TaxID=1314785 RepID=A0A165BJI3_9APHY|nr:Clavaminate synthase-like protein [Laetiporus sulphureus 93-53]KZT01177.1 Clavaminate synthase-like protein [Laetiporus sulphureus 93-53]